MYTVINCQVGVSSGPVFEYFDKITKAGNCLYNATLFRIRQVLTLTEKPPEKWTDNEREVYDEILKALPLMPKKFAMPTKGRSILSYEFLNALLKASDNPDYRREGLPVQSAQHVIKDAVRAMKSFRHATKEYYKKPSSFTGKPKLPGYHQKGGNSTIILTNQDCVVYPKKDGPGYEVKFPKFDKRMDLGNAPITGRLKQVTIKPNHGIFIVSFVFENSDKNPEFVEPRRICSIDPGLENLAAITSNIGAPCLLLKGGVVKSINQLYNKLMANEASQQTSGTVNKFHMTDKTHRICLRRNNQINDFMQKTAARIVNWCVENKIDTIVIGTNRMQKQGINLGHKTNQSFVQVPFSKLRSLITYRAERYGIQVIEREESYTSKASFLDNDYIPTYGVDDKNAHFSGTRPKRGIYKAKDGTRINADLNGSGNILRKEFPSAFCEDGQVPDFNSVIIIRHPDYDRATANRKKQLSVPHIDSKSKLRRLAKKEKRNPSGIELCE